MATYVLGINAYHGDVSAVLLRDGQLVAAVEEERFRRIKHWAGFPTLAIQSVLEMAGIRGGDVRHVAVSRDPRVAKADESRTLIQRFEAEAQPKLRPLESSSLCARPR